MTKLKIDNELRKWIPPLQAEELALLEESLVREGCRDPLVTWQGLLLDGHHRYEICTRRGITFETVAIDLPNMTAALDWMDTNQLGRRNLTADQRSLLRGRIYNRTKKAAHGRADRTFGDAEAASPNTAKALAEVHRVSERTIKSDGKKAEAIEKLAETNPEAAAAVQSGAKKFNEVRREIKLAEVKEAAVMPAAKYRIIYADPPWKYGDQLTAEYGAVKYHYPAMTIGELCALPVADLAEDDAVLFLWVTSPLLRESFAIVDAWGFAYKTSFIWDKVKHNMGHYNSVRHELLLICTRGSCLPDTKQLVDSVQSIERSARHSEKPEEFRAIIEKLYVHGKRLELFRRGKNIDGWDAWGNEHG